MTFSAAKQAVLDGNLLELQTLLKENPSLAQARASRDDHGHEMTLLHLATGMGEVSWPDTAPETARLLLDFGAEVDAGEDRSGGETPLIHAVSVNNVPVMEVLLDAGADLERHGRYNTHLDTPLGYALFYGVDTRLPRYPRQAAELLIDRGAWVNSAFAAALGRFTEALKEESALEQGTALLFACRYGQNQVAGQICELDLNLNQIFPFFHASSSPLHMAAIHGNPSLLQLLIDAGADPNLKDGKHHATPMEWAAFFKKDANQNFLQAFTRG